MEALTKMYRRRCDGSTLLRTGAVIGVITLVFVQLNRLSVDHPVVEDEGLDVEPYDIGVMKAVSWSNATKGVINCRTGIVTRPIEGGRQLADLNKGIQITLLDAKSPETNEERVKSFVNIFNKKLWQGQASPVKDSDAIIGSGPGSTLAKTRNVVVTLDVVIEHIKKVLGGFHTCERRQ